MVCKNICLHRGGQCYWWGKPEYPEKATELPQVSDKLDRILYRVHLAWAGFELITLVVIGNDCICSCKSNFHTITTTKGMSQIVQPITRTLIWSVKIYVCWIFVYCFLFGDPITSYNFPQRFRGMLLMGETGVSGESHRTAASQW
jgi:hypothetical protein